MSRTYYLTLSYLPGVDLSIWTTGVAIEQAQKSNEPRPIYKPLERVPLMIRSIIVKGDTSIYGSSKRPQYFSFSSVDNLGFLVRAESLPVITMGLRKKLLPTISC